MPGAQKDHTAADQAARYVVFGLSGRTLALPAAAVTRFLPVPALERPPDTAPVVAGVFRWHGHVVPVLRLDRLLGLGDAPIALYATLLVILVARPQGLFGEAARRRA